VDTDWAVAVQQLKLNIDGDPGVHGRAYVSFPGSGFAHYNYLLNRDLDPANNDNSPAFVYKVA
jgi:hypothetical protein